MQRRVLALVIDLGVVGIASLALASTLGMYFAERAVIMLRIDDPDSLWRGPIPLMLGTFGEVTYLLPFLFAAVWSLDLLGGTLGKRLCQLRIVDIEGGPATLAARVRRWAVQCIGGWGVTLALLTGRWELALLSAVMQVAVWLAGIVLLSVGGRLTHDALSRTRVAP